MVWWFDILLQEIAPTYIRLNRWGEKDLHILKEIDQIEIKKWVIINEWKDWIIFCTGNISLIVKEAIEEFSKHGFSIQVVSLPFIKPINKKSILDHIKWFSFALTVEEHSIIGWLWSCIAEIIAEENINIKFKRLGINDSFFYLAWDENYMRSLAWIGKEDIIETIKFLLINQK